MAGKLEITTLFGTVYYAGMEVNPKDKRKKRPIFVNPKGWWFGKIPPPVLFNTLTEMRMTAKRIGLDKCGAVAYYLFVEVTEEKQNADS